MKNLNITMTIKANSKTEAEAIAARELMQLAKETHCTMASGSGDAVYADGGYIVKSEMNMDGDVHVIHDVQERWLYNPAILNSAICINDTHKAEEHEPETETPYTCDDCGRSCDDTHVVNPGLNSERILCDECWDDSLSAAEIDYCETCESYVDHLIKNPVTHNETVCPVCGNNIN